MIPRRRSCLVFLSSLAAIALVALPLAADDERPRVGIAELAWLAGDWQGTLANGATFQAHYTDAAGGVILSVSKELRNGRVVFYELEHFAERNGVLVYTPHPNGEHRPGFSLASYDAEAKRAVFENAQHDFPKKFTFAQPAPDRLVITLSGPGKDGAEKQVVFDLRRASR